MRDISAAAAATVGVPQTVVQSFVADLLAVLLTLLAFCCFIFLFVFFAAAAAGVVGVYYSCSCIELLLGVLLTLANFIANEKWANYNSDDAPDFSCIYLDTAIWLWDAR